MVYIHDELQAACWKWACTTYHPFIYRNLIAVPNDAARGNKALARHLQAIGVTPGVWDMHLHWFTQLYDYHDLLITVQKTFWWEFKVGSDKLSDNQIKFRACMQPLGHTFFIAHDQDEFQTQFKSVVEPTLGHAKIIFKERGFIL